MDARVRSHLLRVWDCLTCAGATMQQYNSAGHVHTRAMQHERPEPQNRIPRFRTLAVGASSADAHALRGPRLPPHIQCGTCAEATMVQFGGASRSRCHPGGCPIRSLRVCRHCTQNELEPFATSRYYSALSAPIPHFLLWDMLNKSNGALMCPIAPMGTQQCTTRHANPVMSTSYTE